MDRRDQTDTLNGFGDGLTRAFEFALVPTIFGALGYLLDQWFGSGQVFTLSLAFFGVVGMFVSTWFSYDAAMKHHEAEGPWARSLAPGTQAARKPSPL